MTESDDKKGGAGMAIGIGCLVVLLLLGFAGYAVVRNVGKITRSAGATIVTKVAETIVNESGLSAEEKASVMKPIKDLAAEFKAGEITMEQAGSIMGKIAEGPLMSLITVKIIETRYINASTLSTDEKQNALKIASRYGEACTRGLITANEEDQDLGSIISTKSTDSDGETTTKLKDTLSDEELQQCITIMKTGADNAGIPDKMHELDIGKAISEAIAKAKADSAK